MDPSSVSSTIRIFSSSSDSDSEYSSPISSGEILAVKSLSSGSVSLVISSLISGLYGWGCG